MNVSEYPHPERLKIPNKLVFGPEDWEVLNVFTTPTMTGPKEVALLFKHKPNPKTVFEMKLAQINEDGLTTMASEVVGLEHRGSSYRLDRLIDRVYFQTDDPKLTQPTKEYRELDAQLKIYHNILTAEQPFIPAWRETAKALAPYVAAFFLYQPETQKIV